MDQAILVNDQIDAGKLFVDAFHEYSAVDAAFWLNPADSGEWFLYIASFGINDDNFDIAYGEVLRLAGHKRNMWLDAFQIKLLSSEDPLAKKVIEIRDRYPASIATRYNGSSIAGLSINGAYIYPLIDRPTNMPIHREADQSIAPGNAS